MTDAPRINEKRIQRIRETLEQIAKTNRSQRADEAEVEAMRASIANHVQQTLGGELQARVGPEPAAPLDPQPSSEPWPKGSIAGVRQSAFDLSLRDQARLASDLMENCFHHVLERAK